MLYRLRDTVVSVLLLGILLPFLLLLVLYLFFRQKKIFFKQERTGFQEKAFRIYKFCTYTEEGLIPTPDGVWLRRFSLNEIPQLWNVIKGDMSLVGPRPLLHEYLPLYSDAQRKRFLGKPGITGWAQVNGRNDISFSETFALDVWYVEHKSFWLDLEILFKTCIQLFIRKDKGLARNYPFNGQN